MELLLELCVLLCNTRIPSKFRWIASQKWITLKRFAPWLDVIMCWRKYRRLTSNFDFNRSKFNSLPGLTDWIKKMCFNLWDRLFRRSKPLTVDQNSVVLSILIRLYFGCEKKGLLTVPLFMINGAICLALSSILSAWALRAPINWS